MLDADARERVRDALVASAGTAPRRSRRWAFAAVAALGVFGTLVAGAIALFGGSPTLHGTIRALPGAVFEHTGPAADERVVLRDGTVAVEVSPLGTGERFRVVTADAEVEVRGTAFEVVASADHLLAVRVSHGRVEVRPERGAPTTLSARESWTRPSAPVADTDADADADTKKVAVTVPAAPVAPAPARTPPKPQRRRADPPVPSAPPPRTATVQASPTELAFDEGFAALRAGAPIAAAEAFGRAAGAGGELAEDASFWRAVALHRANRTDAALAAFVAFIDRYPRSARAGEAAVAAGWLELDVGRTDDAAAHFRAAVDDPAPRIRASAADGLRAVTGK